MKVEIGTTKRYFEEIKILLKKRAGIKYDVMARRDGVYGTLTCKNAGEMLDFFYACGKASIFITILKTEV